MAENYIRDELDKLKKDKLLSYIGCSAGPKKKTNIFEWNAIIKGPNNSCYENGMFQIAISFPNNYPTDPPKFHFVTKIYHPNINLENGVICLSTLSTDWEDNPNIVNALYSIYDLLKMPNTDHGLNSEALLLYKNDPETFKIKAKDFTNKNALKIIDNN